MGSDEYQLTSRKELIELKDQLRRLKDGSVSPDKNIHLMMADLQRTMLDMMSLFKEASRDMKEDEAEQTIAKKLDEACSKIDIMIDQNEKIADGIVSVADLIKELKQKPIPVPQPAPSYSPPNYGQPSFNPMPELPENPDTFPQLGPLPPPPLQQAPGMSLPPPPPRPPQKRPFPGFMQ